MKTYWVAAMTISGLLAAGAPVSAQTDAPAPAPTPATPSPPAPPAAAAAPSPNVSFPMKKGGTYQGPLNGQPGPTRKFYKGYNRT